MKILLLAGGGSNERNISLLSGKAVAEALNELGYSTVTADPRDGQRIENLVDGVDVVFLALHGAGGEDGTLQAELEKLGKPFVGSGSKSSALCFDKWIYKDLLKANGLPASAGYQVTTADIGKAFFKEPYVLKPNKGGSSLDTQIVRRPTESSLQESLSLLNKYSEMLLEPLIEGTEITVGVLVDKALPVAEIIPPAGLEFDYENKYNGLTEELCPPKNIEVSLQQKAKHLAVKTHQLTGCRDISRTDMIVDNNKRIHILETNTIPGLTSQSLLPKMALEAGMSMPELIGTLIKSAYVRSSSKNYLLN